MRGIVHGIIIILLLAFTVGLVQGGISGRFPEEGAFNGMYIEYQVDGASATTQKDYPGFDTSREIKGSLSPGSGTLTLSGTVYTGGGYGASANAGVTADGKTSSKDLGFIKTGWPNYNSAPFSVSVPYTPGTKAASFSIAMSGDYNAGPRGLDVSGELTGQGTGTGSSGSGTSSTGTKEPDTPADPIWIAVVGVGAAAVIGAGIALKNRPKGVKKEGEQKKDDKEEEQVTYILQLSADKIAVTTKKAADLNITAWKQVGESPPVYASEVAIEISPPPEAPGISVKPLYGTGGVSCIISLENPVDPGNYILKIHASAGTTGINSQVEVEVAGIYSVEVT